MVFLGRHFPTVVQFMKNINVGSHNSKYNTKVVFVSCLGFFVYRGRGLFDSFCCLNWFSTCFAASEPFVIIWPSPGTDTHHTVYATRLRLNMFSLIFFSFLYACSLLFVESFLSLVISTVSAFGQLLCMMTVFTIS